jgi:putative nucleotidyltransferase with HDIG domain
VKENKRSAQSIPSLLSSSVVNKGTETSSPPIQKGYAVNSNQPDIHHVSSHKVYLYIAAVCTGAVLALALGYKLIASGIPQTPHGWVILAALIMLTIFTEGLSVNLYVGNTSISTTAVPLVAGFILFGPFGTVVCSAAYAISAALKFKSPLNRLVFNFSNHVIAGMFINFIVTTSGVFLQNWNIGLQLLCTLASSIVIYFVTTILISIGMGIDLKQSPLEIWKEQYQWMALYYIGIGFVSYSLIFGYIHADLLGIVFLAVPLLLLRFSQVQYVGHTRNIVKELRKKNLDLEKSADEIQELSEGLLTTLSEIIDLRDPYVLGHSKQVSVHATEIAKELSINARQVDLIRKAGLLHDIGKLGISTTLLTKPSNLTANEYEAIKKHSALGGDLVKNTPSLRPLAQIIRHHHERYDGNGYPDRVVGNQIGIEARIVSVADAIEAMSSDRPYRRALKPEKIKEELIQNSGSQFDPLVVEAAIKVLEKIWAEEATPTVQSEKRSGNVKNLATETQAS